MTTEEAENIVTGKYFFIVCNRDESMIQSVEVNLDLDFWYNCPGHKRAYNKQIVSWQRKLIFVPSS